MSLRWRIALGLGIIAALVATAGALGTYLSTAHELRRDVDQSLVTRVQTLRDEPSPGPGGPQHVDPDYPCPQPGSLEPAAAAQVVEANGSVKACIGGSTVLPVAAADRSIAQTGSKRRLRTVTIDGTRYRLLSAPWRGGTVLQTARSLRETESVLSSLQLRLLVLGLAGIAAAALLGWLFARRLVRPIDRLRGAAERIARTQELDAPVPDARGGDEIASLTGSFSTMVDALSASRRQQQQLVSDASHELRTPLTSLQTNAELLDRGAALTPDQQRAAARGIRLEVQELTNLVSELVELATDRANDDEAPARVELGEVAERVVERARRRTGREIALSVAGDDEVVARPGMVERAASNLVDNALKYSGAGIEVTVDGRRLAVRDHGPGIADRDLPKLFDRFYRSVSARAQPGSGLGLAIVKQILERHDGRVWAANAAGGGAEVGFELPAPGAAAT